MMNILVVMDTLWRNDNGVGNSYSNIFFGMNGVRIRNISCQEGISKNEVSEKCFQISEKRLIKNLLDKETPSGIVEQYREEKENRENGGIFKWIKRSRWQVFFWLRNLIWKVGRWQSNELREFIDDFEPDLIFAQLQDKMYLNNLTLYIKEYTKKPLVVYAWDDVYSLKQFSCSPLFWIDRFLQRKSIRNLVSKSDILYTIAKEQKEEYEKSLNVRTELLYKGKEFLEPCSVNCDVKEPIEFVYTGNLYSGRIKTLQRFCKELAQINKDCVKAHISVYSSTPLTKKETDSINISGTSDFYGSVSEEEVQEVQKKSDVLLHIEPFTLKGSLACRLSFSTKLVDYFYNEKCIFAIGAPICASMKYLKRNNAAIVVESLEKIGEELRRILAETQIIKDYAYNSWSCGSNNHQIADIQNKLTDNFNEITRRK